MFIYIKLLVKVKLLEWGSGSDILFENIDQTTPFFFGSMQTLVRTGYPLKTA